MGIMNELEITEKRHNNYELRIQHAEELCDCAARFRPGSGYSSNQDLERPGNMTYGKPTGRTEIGTERPYRCFANAKNQATLPFPTPHFERGTLEQKG